MKGPFLFRSKGWVMVVRALATLMDEVIFKIKGGVMRCLSGYGKNRGPAGQSLSSSPHGGQYGSLFLGSFFCAIDRAEVVINGYIEQPKQVEA